MYIKRAPVSKHKSSFLFLPTFTSTKA